MSSVCDKFKRSADELRLTSISSDEYFVLGFIVSYAAEEIKRIFVFAQSDIDARHFSAHAFHRGSAVISALTSLKSGIIQIGQ